MHLALQITGYGALLFLGLTGFFYKAANRAGDDFGAVFPLIAAGGVAGLLTLAWLVLIIIKAASA